MSKEKHNYLELAKKFADKNISFDQLEALNEKVKNDKNVADEVAFQIALRKSFEQNQAKEEILADELKEVLAKHRSTNSKGRYLNNSKKILLVAASIIGIFLLWFTIDFFLAQHRKSQIATQELSKMASEAITKNKLSTTIDLENLLYNNDFNAAINLCIKEKKKFKDACKNDVANYHLGKLQLYYQPKRDLTQAIQALKCIQENYRNAYPDIFIHLARAYLWSGNEIAAQQVLPNNSINLPEDLKKLMD